MVVRSTEWQRDIQQRLNEAGRVAALANRNITVVEQPGKYEFYMLDVPPHVGLVFGSGRCSREGDLVYVGGDNQPEPLVTIRGGYSGGLAGCQIRDKSGTAKNLIGIRVSNAINPFVENVRVDLRGVDCIGLEWMGRESLAVDRAELRASVPLSYRWGDNGSFRNCDLGATGTSEVLPPCVLHLTGLPHQLTFDGYQTWQGGDYAIFGIIPDRPSTGQLLILNSVRWEQSTSVDDPDKPGILIDCRGRAFEGLTQIGCRWSPRKNTSTVIKTNPAYPLVPFQVEFGCYKPVTR